MALKNYNTGENMRQLDKYQALDRELQSTVILMRRETYEVSSTLSQFPLLEMESQTSMADLLKLRRQNEIKVIENRNNNNNTKSSRFKKLYQ